HLDFGQHRWTPDDRDHRVAGAGRWHNKSRAHAPWLVGAKLRRAQTRLGCDRRQMRGTTHVTTATTTVSSTRPATESSIEDRGVKFARRVFSIAGWYGLVVMLPNVFLEAKIGRDFPPAITHPENYYGFICVTLAWQVLFLIIARDPVRFRPAMIAAILEKFPF